MPKKRALVAYCVDVDACAGWINTKDGSPANGTDITRGIFGATTGTDRLLKFFADNDIKASWFMPSHTILSFPTQMAKVRDAGHEIGLHGYTHEHVSRLSPQQERAILSKTIEIHRAFTGKYPSGWVAPAWETSAHSIRLLSEFHIAYDHSQMASDSQPYWAFDCVSNNVSTNYSAAASVETWMVPMTKVQKTDVVEIPPNWSMDDWPPLQYSGRNAGTHGFVDVGVLRRGWEEGFEWLWREEREREGGFVFTVSVHPQVSGRAGVMGMHERFVEFLRGHEGVEFVTCEFVAEEFRAGRLRGVEIKAGV